MPTKIHAMGSTANLPMLVPSPLPKSVKPSFWAPLTDSLKGTATPVFNHSTDLMHGIRGRPASGNAKIFTLLIADDGIDSPTSQLIQVYKDPFQWEYYNLTNALPGSFLRNTL
jgi:hypothetical protein